MNFDSILAVSDFSALSAHALDRAALLAKQHQTPLRLVHFADSPKTYVADPIARLGQRARQLARRHEIAVHALERSVSLDEVMAEASASSLLVMGPLSHRSWKRLHLGTTLDQAVHSSVCPLLVVKQAPEKPYARVLVAVDLSPRSKSLIDFVGRFSTPSVLTLFHAIDTIDEAKLRAADVPLEVIQANQFGSRLQARDRLAQLIGTLDVDRHSLAFDIGHGDPAYSTAFHLQATRGELVVVGKRHSSSLVHFFSSSVAQRLVKLVDSDVLVAPLERLNSDTFAEHSH